MCSYLYTGVITSNRPFSLAAKMIIDNYLRSWLNMSWYLNTTNTQIIFKDYNDKYLKYSLEEMLKNFYELDYIMNGEIKFTAPQSAGKIIIKNNKMIFTKIKEKKT